VNFFRHETQTASPPRGNSKTAKAPRNAKDAKRNKTSFVLCALYFEISPTQISSANKVQRPQFKAGFLLGDLGVSWRLGGFGFRRGFASNEKWFFTA
jgi:hypothetical protein